MHLGLLQFHSHFLRYHGGSGQHGKILHGRLAVVSEPGCFDGTNFDSGTKFVDDQSRQGFALDVFRDDEKRGLRLDDFLKNGNYLLDRRHLLLYEKNLCVF